MSIISTGLTITSSYGSWYIGELPIRADETSVNQYCVEKGYVSGGTFTQDNGRWANDGGRWMNFFDTLSGTTHWFNRFGYDGIITSIIEP